MNQHQRLIAAENELKNARAELKKVKAELKKCQDEKMVKPLPQKQEVSKDALITQMFKASFGVSCAAILIAYLLRGFEWSITYGGYVLGIWGNAFINLLQCRFKPPKDKKYGAIRKYFNPASTTIVGLFLIGPWLAKKTVLWGWPDIVSTALFGFTIGLVGNAVIWFVQYVDEVERK